MMIREKSKRIKRQGRKYRGKAKGTKRTRSSDEVSVMEMERRGSVILTFVFGQPSIWEESNSKKKTVRDFTSSSNGGIQIG